GVRPHSQQGTASSRQRGLRRSTHATLRKTLQHAASTIISTQKFESGGVDRTPADRQSTEELHGTKTSASRGEPAQIPGRSRSDRCATAVTPAARAATTASAPANAPPRRPSALPPTMQVAVAETATPKELPRIGGVPGSDFMVDVIKTLDIK